VKKRQRDEQSWLDCLFILFLDMTTERSDDHRMPCRVCVFFWREKRKREKEHIQESVLRERAKEKEEEEKEGRRV